MNDNHLRAFAINVFLMLCLLLMASACTHSPRSLTPAELDHAYSRAIQDAKVAESSEISRELVAVVPSNEALRWNPETGQVLVTTWTAWDGYDANLGKAMTLSREVWVTAVPELRSFCQAHPMRAADIALRLEQLLGLPPGSEKTRFVEIWVHPKDLFRPAPDPEVSDHEAELSFPVSERFITVSKAHRQWFRELAKRSYGAKGYPWTRLGYTYDWGNQSDEIGLSEFVIRSGATVRIHDIVDTISYCRFSGRQ